MKKRLLGIGALLFILAGVWLVLANSGPLLASWTPKESGREPVAQDPAAALPIEKKVDKAERTENEDPLYKSRPLQGEEMGKLYIPKLDATLPIFHGTHEDELEKGVGHFAGSVLPGERDNSVLSGHRDTVFRRLGEVGKGDLLVVTTSAGTFTYKVRKVRIVDANDRTVIVPTKKPTLTVTTCYPFSFIGDAPERYILVANLLKS